MATRLGRFSAAIFIWHAKRPVLDGYSPRGTQEFWTGSEQASPAAELTFTSGDPEPSTEY